MRFGEWPTESETMSTDPYPTDEELRTIIDWDWQRGWKPLMEYVKTLWWAPGWGWGEKGNRYWLSTWGWSGNEDLIGALERNYMFWSLCWKASKTGGHYRFTLSRRLAKDPDPVKTRDRIAQLDALWAGWT